MYPLRVPQLTIIIVIITLASPILLVGSQHSLIYVLLLHFLNPFMLFFVFLCTSYALLCTSYALLCFCLEKFF